MDELTENINKKTRIPLSRNIPVALVVGAATFLGSNLVDKLLSKNIQVVGVDDLSFGRRENLSKAAEEKNFHLVIQLPGDLDLELERLDYIFITNSHEFDLSGLLKLFKKFGSRLLFVSSIELYGKNFEEKFNWYKKGEVEIARFAKEHNLNARILRLGPVFGPRMDFNSPAGESDPLTSLIQQSLTGDLQRQVSLEFSSRALYADDVIDLLIKCIFAGATAQKIFDGVSPTPVKVSEVKQILLDPVWYENKNFTPTELPPWFTPNLEKTIKFLNWQPKTKLIEAFRKTLNYFKDSEIKVPKLEDRSWKVNDGKMEDGRWKMEKSDELEALKKIGEPKKPDSTESKVSKKGIKIPKKYFPLKQLVVLMVVAFVTYALIWPFVAIGWGALTFRFQLLSAIKSLEKGEFDNSLFSIQQASLGVSEAKSIFYSLEPLRSVGFLKSQFEVGDNLFNLASLSTDAAQNTILGIQSLYRSFKSVTGEREDDPKVSFADAQVSLALADEDLSRAQALLNDQNFKKMTPGLISGNIASLGDRLSLYSNLVKKGRTLSILLPEVIGSSTPKSYLVLLQNNMELRPTGGFIGSFAKVSFEGGKLKKLEVNDIYAIDGQLKIHVEPPKEIKDDLGQKDYFLRDSNWEPDFPTSARQAEWFYTKETGERVEGVVALDISAMEDLLSVVGSLNLPDYNENITSDNLFAKAISHAEVGFFPGSQAKKSFLTALTQSLFNKLFFLPNQNWPGIVTSLGRSLEGKHMSIYLDDPRLFSYVVSQNWSSVLPRGKQEDDNLTADFLAPVEANLGANKSNYYLDRNYNLETVIDKDGEVNHRLRISYVNRSPSETFPAGKYKNRMRVYMPFGTKLSRALWGESDITKDVSSFVDYGRSGYSFLIELAPKEQKTLIMDYQPPFKLQFKDNQALYRLNVVKQAGSLKDPFVWRLTFPLNLRISSDQAQNLGPQEQIIQTDLSTDRSFEVKLSK